MSWCYYAQESIKYGFSKKLIVIYRLIYILSIGWDGICTMEAVWQISDIFNALMAYPNLISIVLLSPQIIKATRNYSRTLMKTQKIDVEKE